MKRFGRYTKAYDSSFYRSSHARNFGLKIREGNIEQEIVVIRSYEFDTTFEEGLSESCHFCGPDYVIATFILENNKLKGTTLFLIGNQEAMEMGE